MGFWNALSVLAPVAPALSDAQDIRTQRQAEAQALAQQVATFPKEQALRDAQLTASRLAAQLDQQRLRSANQPLFKEGSQPEFNPLKGTYTQPAWNSAKGTYEDVAVPGVSPEEEAKYRLESFKRNRSAAHELIPDATPEQLDYLGYTLGGMKPPPFTKLVSLPGAAGQPRLGPEGKSYVRTMFDPATNQNVDQPMPPGYQPPEPKPGTPRPGISHGRNTFGFYNPGKHTWQDAAGTPLPDFQPQPSFAETGLFEPMASYNPQTQSIAMGSFNRRTGGLTFQSGAGQNVPLPPAIAATIGKEFGTAREAQTRLRIMQQNATDALATGNQQAMVSLLMNHIGMTLGAQKGTRVAKSVIDEARLSAPWIDAKLATLGHTDQTGDFIFDGPKGGINLTGEQINQMVGLARQRNDYQWQQVKDTGSTYGVDLTGAIQQTQGAVAPSGGPGGAGGGTGRQSYKQTATGPDGHKIGSNDNGLTWYDVQTGRKL